MSKIALRPYFSFIENLFINEGESANAPGHIANILESFPNNYQALTLAGNYFLEKRDFSSSNAIFDLVLKIEPDDFVSLAGKSFYYESIKDYPSALDYMRRAFELQPTNQQIQDEVKRFLTLISGEKIDQVKLTRGALIKMYAQSGLFKQAISEINLGIHEKPDRIDYQIVLAKMLYESQKITGAIEISLSILKQFPLCKPILELMLAVFRHSDTNLDISVYKDRLIALDPYYRYLQPETKTVLDVPDLAVEIEQKCLDFDENTLLSKINTNWEKTLPFAVDSEKTLTEAIENADDAANNGASKHRFDKEQIHSDQKIQPQILSENVSIPKYTSNPLPENNEIPDSYQEIISNNQDNYFNESELITRDDWKNESKDQTSVDTPHSSTKKDRFLNKLKPTFKETNPEDVPQWVLDNYKSDLPMGSVQSNNTVSENDLPLINVEHLENLPNPEDRSDHNTGIVDDNTPSLDNDQISKDGLSDWMQIDKAEDSNKKTESKEIPNLSDTQPIKTIEQTPEFLLEQIGKAIEGENLNFAFEKIDMMLNEDANINPIIEQLEIFCNKYPKNFQLWLKLSETYKIIGDNEKSLIALKKAQGQITL